MADTAPQTYYADIQLQVTVKFTDDGSSSLIDQALDAVWDMDLSPYDTDASIVGGVRTTDSLGSGR